MAIICINEDGTEHNFDNEYTKFLNGETGSYDGGRNAVEQFQAHLDSQEQYEETLDGLKASEVRLLDLHTTDDCDYVIELIKRNPANYQGGNFRWKSNNRKSALKLSVQSKIKTILHFKARL